MDNKLNNMINEFIKTSGAKNIDELNEQLQMFVQQYNDGEIQYENTPLDDAYELLEKAENAKTKAQALRYAKKAYQTCSDCFDAIIFQVTLEENQQARTELLDEGLEHEKKRLEKAGYFHKENIGRFYGLFETRPYIRGLEVKIQILVVEGKIKQARQVCQEVLRLNTNDNLGVRYYLLAIAAYLEDESALLKVYKKYPEENLETLLPFLIFYYKQSNDKKAIEYLQRINKANPYLITFFDQGLEEEEDVPDGSYSRGKPSEVLMYMERYAFLLLATPGIVDYILEHKPTEKSAD